MAITYQPIIRRIQRYLKLAADPSPLAPARSEQGHFIWGSPSSTRDDWVFGPETRPRSCLGSIFVSRLDLAPAQSDTVAAIAIAFQQAQLQADLEAQS